MIENYQKQLNLIKTRRELYFKKIIMKSNDYSEILNFIDFENGSQPPKSEHIYIEQENYIRFIQNRDYNSSSHLTYIRKSKRNHICEKDDIMIDKYGEAGSVRYGLYGAYNVALMKIIPKFDYTKEFIRDFLSQKQVKELLYKSCLASTRPSLNSNSFIGLKIPVLENYMYEEYEKINSELLNYEFSINFKVEKLRKIKELLLKKYFK